MPVVVDRMPSPASARDTSGSSQDEIWQAYQEESGLRAHLDALEREMGRRRLQCQQSIVIPPEAQRTRNVSFLEGRWESISDLFEARTGRPVRVEYEFNRVGEGTTTIFQDNGSTCTTPIKAHFDDQGQLVFDELRNPRCSRDREFYRRAIIRCLVKYGGEADCTLRYYETNKEVHVELRRKS